MKDKVIHVVESVAEITKYRDFELVGKSLIKALSELIPCLEITLYHLNKKDDPIVLSLGVHQKSLENMTSTINNDGYLPADISAGIIICLNNPKIVEIASPTDNSFHTIFPIFNEKNDLIAFMIIQHTESLTDKHMLISGMQKIYENYIGLLNEIQTDKLTGFLNRQTFDNNILKIIKTPIVSSSYMHLYGETNMRRRIPDENFGHWLVVIDIDHFKQVNDTYGHIYGDEVLILLSRIMVSTFRSDDLLFRYGGEEFVIVLKAPGRDDALIALERFRETVASYNFPRIGQMTISVGYVQIFDSQPPIVYLGQADQALYYAKKHGRNRVCSYEQLISSGKLSKHEDKVGDIELF